MLSKKIYNNVSKGSMIRAMFEEGERLRKIHGPDKVYDFSLGNPDPEPPGSTLEVIKKLVVDETPNLHKYMPNAGFADVRETIAAHIQKETGIPMTAANIIMTCGAAGALNVVFKAILNPGDEVIAFAPYFVEYGTYVDNHGGKLVVSTFDRENFEPDLEDLEKNINASTRAIILNSPNNPTGVVYSEAKLKAMAALLEKKEKELGSKILVISDEPYIKLVYEGTVVPSILKIFKNSVIITSYSKSLSLPGERIGYIAINSSMEEASSLFDGFAYCNRILGFVNAPSMFQKVISQSLNDAVDVKIYQERRDILYNHLIKIGFSCIKPQGAFYLFPKALIENDVEFTRHAAKYNLLLVPGSGFGCPGHFRIAYCVGLKTIENSLPAFEALAKDFL